MAGLIKKKNTLLGSRLNNLPYISDKDLTDILILIQNGIIESIPVAKKDIPKKQKMKLSIIKPKKPAKKRTREQAEKDFAMFGKVIDKKDLN